MKFPCFHSVAVAVILAILVGCSNTNSYLANQSVMAPPSRKRDSTIEIKTWNDKRESIDQEGFEFGKLFILAFIPLVPFIKTHNQKNTPPLRIAEGSYTQNGFPVQGTVDYDIPALLANYIQQSGICEEVYLEKSPYKGEQCAAPCSACDREPASESDIVITGDLEQFKRTLLLTFYGLGPASPLSLYFFSGDSAKLSANFTFTATDRTSGRVLARKQYIFERSTSFNPVFAAWGHGFYLEWSWVYELIAPDVHNACRDFVRELDRALPPPDDPHWNTVALERQIRIAKAKGLDTTTYEILNPAQGMRTGHSRLALQGKVQSIIGLQTVQVQVNGQSFPLADTNPGGKKEVSLRLSQIPQLLRGVNVIEISAADLAGNKSKRTVEVTYDPSLAPASKSDQERRAQIRKIEQLLIEARQVNPNGDELQELTERLERMR
jgi:hypothetical protein